LEQEKCAMCKIKLTNSNVGKWKYKEDTERYGKIRLDSAGRKWCQRCADEFDKIDWSE